MKIALENQLESKILWKQVLGLALLNACISLGWMVYESYQPVLLEKFNFISLATLFIVAQGLIGAVLNPISGKIADKMMKRYGSRFPIITFGIILAAVVFISVSIAALSNADSLLRWILPVLVICWLIAMSIFHSPAVSLIEDFASMDRLPSIMAILTIMIGFVHIAEPAIRGITQSLGLTFTFILGGILLIISGSIFKNMTQHLRDVSVSPKKEIVTVNPISEFMAFTIGIMIGLFQGILFFLIPLQFDKMITPIKWINPHYTLSAILAISIICIIPISKMVEKWHENKSMIISCISTTFSLILLIYAPNIYVYAIALICLGVTYSLVSVSSLPFVLKKSASQRVGLVTGLYFGGASIGMAIVMLCLKVA